MAFCIPLIAAGHICPCVASAPDQRKEGGWNGTGQVNPGGILVNEPTVVHFYCKKAGGKNSRGFGEKVSVKGKGAVQLHVA